jgi:hypothetical protein
VRLVVAGLVGLSEIFGAFARLRDLICCYPLKTKNELVTVA